MMRLAIFLAAAVFMCWVAPTAQGGQPAAPVMLTGEPYPPPGTTLMASFRGLNHPYDKEHELFLTACVVEGEECTGSYPLYKFRYSPPPTDEDGNVTGPPRTWHATVIMPEQVEPARIKAMWANVDGLVSDKSNAITVRTKPIVTAVPEPNKVLATLAGVSMLYLLPRRAKRS